MVSRGTMFPVTCGAATRNSGTHALLDLIVEGVQSPAKKGTPIETDANVAAFVFKTVADPFAGRISVFRVYAGEVTPDTTLVNHRDHSKERLEMPRKSRIRGIAIETSRSRNSYMRAPRSVTMHPTG